MHITVQHTRLFRRIYGRPKQSNVLCRIFIGIEYGIAVITSKLFTLSLTYIKAIIAGLTRVLKFICNQITHFFKPIFSQISFHIINKPSSKDCVFFCISNIRCFLSILTPVCPSSDVIISPEWTTHPHFVMNGLREVTAFSNENDYRPFLLYVGDSPCHQRIFLICKTWVS